MEDAILVDAPPAPGGHAGRKRGRPSKRKNASKCEDCRKDKLPCGPDCKHRASPGEHEGDVAEAAGTAASVAAPDAESSLAEGGSMGAASERQV